MKICAGLFFAMFSIVAFADDLNFTQALTEMIDANVDVRVQQTKARAADAQVLAARGLFSPTLSLTAQQLNAGGSGISTAGVANPTSGQLYGGSVTWNLFRSGSDSASVDAALSDRHFQNVQLDASILSAEGVAAQALFDYLESKQAVEAYRRSEVSAKQFMAIAEERFKKSLLPHEDLDRVVLDAANAEAKRADAETQFILNKSKVESLLGHARVQFDWPWGTQLEPNGLRELTQEPQTALVERPDYLAAKADADTQEFKGRSLYRVMYPSIDLNVSDGLMELHGQSSNGWTSTATLTIPLWNGFKDYSAYRVQIEQHYAAEARRQQTLRTVESDVHATQASYRLAFDQYQTRMKNVNVAKHIMDQDAARFKIGRADADALNVDLNRVTTAEILALQGVEQVHLAYVALKHAFGKRAL